LAVVREEILGEEILGEETPIFDGLFSTKTRGNGGKYTAIIIEVGRHFQTLWIASRRDVSAMEA
jgi:hypothetical protein